MLSIPFFARGFFIVLTQAWVLAASDIQKPGPRSSNSICYHNCVRYLTSLLLLRIRCNKNTRSPGRRSARLTCSRHIRLVIWADVMGAVTAALPASPPVSPINAFSSVGASMFGFARFASSKALVICQHLVPPRHWLRLRKIGTTQRFRQGRFLKLK
jgi:hypothetical protein